jgi:short-subunit dehydrogenase
MPQRKVVVVTGASAGVGRATAYEFARRGFDLGLISRNAEALQAVKQEVEGVGARAVACSVDVAVSDQLEAAADDIERQLGPIDVWVNNAMLTVVSPVAELQAAEIKRVTEVTYLGTVHGTLCALRRMRKRNRGTIVQVGSALAYRAIPLQAPYCGAKFAIRGFTDSLRSELLHERSRIHLTMVQLPAINTPQFDWCKTHMPNEPQPIAPVFQPEVAARAIVWAAQHKRRELFVGNSTLKAVIANALAPGLVDRLLAWIGYTGQQSDKAVEPSREDNLWHTPQLALYRTHGRFDGKAHTQSGELWMATHRAWLIGGLVIGALLAWDARAHSRRSPGPGDNT